MQLMNGSAFLHVRRFVAVVACASLFFSQTSYARDAAGFLAATEQALAAPRVYLGGTTPLSPVITTGNRLVSFQPGTELAMRHLCDTIRAAENEILLQVYEWDDRDESGRMVREALRDRMAQAKEELRSAPLVIRVIVNHSWPTRRETPHHLLRELFGEAVRNDPNGERVLLELNHRKGFAFSVVHAKYAVIDGAKLLLRTNNFLTMDGVSRDFYNFSAQLEGPVAVTVRDDWLGLRAESTPVKGASHGPDTWPELPPQVSAIGQAGAAAEGKRTAGMLGSPMAVLAKNSRANFLTEGPPNPQNAGLVALIGASEHEIVSLNPALNVVAIKRAIEDAIVQRGVDVTMVLSLNMSRQVQHRLQGGDNADTVYDMLGRLLARGGVDAANRLHVRWASDGTGGPAPADTLGNNHAKTALYDGEALWLGSMNWDWQSWSNSRELSVVVFDRSVAPGWQQQIWQPVWHKAAPLAAADLPPCEGPKASSDAVCAYLQLGRDNGQKAP
jgi:phosphatidylserine/phosphatidylglycerophosphate/cardiolipin synthase-like enzyme